MVYYQLSLDKKLSKMWKKEKNCKKVKRKGVSTKSIDAILMRISERSRRIKALDNVYAKHKIITILDEVIGADYFGTTQNRKRFYHLVNKITTQSRYECVYLSNLSKGYDIKRIPWLQEQNLNEVQARQLLQRTNLYLLQYIVKPLIKHFYHALKNFRGYEIKFIPRKKWHSYQHRILNKLLGLGYLVPLTAKCPGVCMPRGILRLFPKIDCNSLEYRPLISPIKYSFHWKAKVRRILKQIDCIAKEMRVIGSASLFLSWEKYSRSIAGQNIYGIKLDIKDAFGNVNVERLCDIIRETKFSDTDKEFIINHVVNQYVLFHKKLYRWNHGLLQGDHLSASLCNLFLTAFEKEHFIEFRTPECFIHRIVDDYFFCSTNKSDIQHFEYVVRNTFELNDSKTQMVLDNNECEIIYFGQVFNLKSREVNKMYSFKKCSAIRHKFKFWNIKCPVPERSKQTIIMRTLTFSYNNHCFKRMELNTKFNSEGRVLINFFEGMIYIAFKLDAAVMAVRDYRQDAEEFPSLTSIVENVICMYSKIAHSKIRRENYKGEHFSGDITFRLLKNIAYRAFILVLKKRSEFYKHIIDDIKARNNLYLCLGRFYARVKDFSKLPLVFENVQMGRRSEI